MMRQATKDLINLNNSITYLRNAQWNYLIVVIVLGLLILLLASNIIVNTYKVVSLVYASEQRISTLSRYSAMTQSRPSAASSNIDQWNLFGSPLIPILNSSNFSLLGIEFSGNNDSARAIIYNTSTNEDGLYKVGDQVTGGVTINNITQNEVILLNNGKKEKLSLLWEEENSPQTSPPATPNYNSPPRE